LSREALGGDPAAVLSARRMERPTLKFNERARTALSERPMLAKAGSFAMVGVVNTLIDFGIFSLAHFKFGLPIIAANVVSWAIAVSGSYVMNSLFTFAAESQRKLRPRQYLAFVTTQVGGLLANTATVLAASYVMPVLAAKVLAIGVTFVVNFSLSHFAVFRPRG
jgi:putative flippase GtrA